MFGCDYVRSVPGVGFVTVLKKILPEVSSVNAGELAEQMKTVSKKTPLYYDSKLLQVSSLFSHALVLPMDRNQVPLNDFKRSRYWGDLIGFRQDPSDVLFMKSDHYFEAFNLENCSFKTLDGSSLQKLKVPAHGSDYGDTFKNNPLPEFSEINFQKIPTKYYANGMLQACVSD